MVQRMNFAQACLHPRLILAAELVEWNPNLRASKSAKQNLAVSRQYEHRFQFEATVSALPQASGWRITIEMSMARMGPRGGSGGKQHHDQDDSRESAEHGLLQRRLGEEVNVSGLEMNIQK